MLCACVGVCVCACLYGYNTCNKGKRAHFSLFFYLDEQVKQAQDNQQFFILAKINISLTYYKPEQGKGKTESEPKLPIYIMRGGTNQTAHMTVYKLLPLITSLQTNRFCLQTEQIILIYGSQCHIHFSQLKKGYWWIIKLIIAAVWSSDLILSKICIVVKSLLNQYSKYCFNLAFYSFNYYPDHYICL